MTSFSRPEATFHTTRWTQVQQAKTDSDDGRKALADLCDVYYEPVIVFLCCELNDADLARDMSHAFFAEMIAGGTIRMAERAHGRFRSYLLGAVKHFLSRQRQADQSLKRGGGFAHVSLDEDASAVRTIPDKQQTSPDVAFDRQWALTVLTQAMEALRAEYTADGKTALFDNLKPWLMGDAAHGDQAALATASGMGVSALKMAVQRLRQQFRRCIQTEIAETLDNPEMVQAEMRVLMTALSA